MPSKVKHRKWMKGRRRGEGVAARKITIAFGEYGLRAITHGWITSRQIEAARKVMSRHVKRGGKIWIRIFPDKPITTKGMEMPMGKGKGAPDHYVVIVKPGMVLFEMGGIALDEAKAAMGLAAYKLPVKTRFEVK